MSKAAVDLAAARIAEAARQQAGPLIVAIDGRSGTGKSTLAKALSRRLPAVVIEGDNFHAGGTGILGDPAAARAARCIDWQAQRPVLSALRKGFPARYHAFAWERFDGSACAGATIIDPAPIVILKGVYAARPQLVRPSSPLHPCPCSRGAASGPPYRARGHAGTLGTAMAPSRSLVLCPRRTFGRFRSGAEPGPGWCRTRLDTP